MRPSLDGARAKIRRAVDSVLDLQCRVDEFSISHPVELARAIEADGHEHVYRITGWHIPPLSLSAIIGEILHDLRSALDNIVWELSSLHPQFADANEGKRQALRFPIAADSSVYNIGVGTHLPLLSEEARAKISALQPFRIEDPAQHPLMILKRLHLVDNQRPLHLRRILTAEGTIDLPPNIKRPIARWNYSALDLNAELVRFIFSESLPTWDLNFKPVFGLAIGELQHLALDMSPIELLRAVTDFVSESVMPEFMPFFPSCG